MRTPEHSTKRTRPRPLGALRYGLAAACLLGAVIWLTDWQGLWQALCDSQPAYLVGCIMIYYLGVWLSCLKWQSLLRAQGIEA
ncbi:MAG: hypothetical protein HGA65_08400, partial [Oscillochloris sp.]|nr:hypothetical protein [Oscillochloris sp.]